ncbi:MAG: flagellar hook-basal body complex protein FliE [Holosporales bacterium]
MTQAIKTSPQLASQAYAGAANIAPQAPSSGSSFAAFLNEPIQGAIEASRQSESVALAAAQGQASLLEVMEASTRANIAVQEFQSVWSNLLEAVREINRSSM